MPTILSATKCRQRPSQNAVISAEAADGFTVRRAVKCACISFCPGGCPFFSPP